ncbi:MAG: UDP-N-acetylmuramoyl-L-alanine--D-glutamate ligase [Faecalibacterium sp.]|jgi:UDP-N-acetylmuramoylalanine--D-glutamate ligase|nr:UDP-N-acetylmuramoyl-L-alanine--D-glutamate ligase [Faecalibacterium sp.]
MQQEQQKLAALICGKKVAFIGAGVSHKALIPAFAEMGAKVTLCDKKEKLEDFGDFAATIEKYGVALSLGEHYMDGFAGQDIILRTPGFEFYQKPLQDALHAGAMVTSEVELFFEFCPCEIVAVTGSDGKTTTTTLISKFYEAAGRTVHLGGNIGAALLPMLPEVRPEDVAVVELSSFQLISMRRSPKIAVVTNVTPNHLDHHKDMQEYIDAKRNILLHQTPPCREVLGYENEITRGMQKDCKGTQVWFTRLHDTDNGAFLRKDGMLCMAENGKITPFLAQKDVKLRGLHNIENLLAAAAAVWGEVPVSCIQKVGSTFMGVEHRIEPVRTLDGVTWYNDSIASSPTRTIAGLRSFAEKIILIAGGYDKKIPYEPLAPEIVAHVKHLVLMGATAPRIEKALREDPGFAASGLVIDHAKDMEEAVALARKAAKPGDVVSLSPASASFDLYPNFEVRGKDFKRIVNALR